MKDNLIVSIEFITHLKLQILATDMYLSNLDKSTTNEEKSKAGKKWKIR